MIVVHFRHEVLSACRRVVLPGGCPLQLRLGSRDWRLPPRERPVSAVASVGRTYVGEGRREEGCRHNFLSYYVARKGGRVERGEEEREGRTMICLCEGDFWFSNEYSNRAHPIAPAVATRLNGREGGRRVQMCAFPQFRIGVM